MARCSLPSIQPTSHNNHGGITNLIPFRGLNLMVLTYVALFTIYWFLVYSYNFTMDELGLLEHATVPKAVGNTAVRTRGYILTLVLLSLLLTNPKAKEYTRRKVAGWWDQQVLVRLSSQIQPVVIQQTAANLGANQQTAASLSTSRPTTARLANNQPPAAQLATSQQPAGFQVCASKPKDPTQEVEQTGNTVRSVSS